MTISLSQVEEAQAAWCAGLVRIASAYKSGADFRSEAAAVVDELYDYANGTVFFKPTLAHGNNTFRCTRDGAISYFVGGNENYPEDTGFALKGWTRVSFDNNAAENGIQIHGEIAITMGNVYLYDDHGMETRVDKTFVFRRCGDGKLRLCVHKSALPYYPA